VVFHHERLSADVSHRRRGAVRRDFPDTNAMLAPCGDTGGREWRIFRRARDDSVGSDGTITVTREKRMAS